MYETNCPICRSSEYKVFFDDHNRRDNIDCYGIYVQCYEYSLIYLRQRAEWEEIVKFYSLLDPDITTNAGQVDVKSLRREAEKPVPKWKELLRKVRFRPHSWPLESVQPGSKRLLDIGCGSGVKLFEFAERGYDVWGVDVGEDTIRLCKELLQQGHFIQGELQESDLPDVHFDYIRIDNALEHVPNSKEVITECRRLLCGGAAYDLCASWQESKHAAYEGELDFCMDTVSSTAFYPEVLRAVDGRSRFYRYSNLWLLSHIMVAIEFYAVAREKREHPETQLSKMA